MNELALFAGAGGGILGGKLLGWRTVCAVERDAYAAQVLAQRQNDGVLETFPIWSDVSSFDGKPWRGIVDVVSGGFPCQDISVAGKGAGLSGKRSGLWSEFARIIGEVRPQYAFIENSPRLAVLGLDAVLSDLARLGYDAEWCVLSAADCGAPHLRERIWILAADASSQSSNKALGNTDNYGQPAAEIRKSLTKRNGNYTARSQQACELARPSEQYAYVGDTKSTRFTPRIMGLRKRKFGRAGSRAGWWQAEPDVGRVADGVEFRVDRLKAIGNGQVPIVAATAFNLLRVRLDEM